MPQIQNFTLGPVVTVPAATDRLFRVVPSQPDMKSVAFEHAPDNISKLATRIVGSTRRKADYSQQSMLRVNSPIIRGVENEQVRVGANIVEVSFAFDSNSTSAEKAESIDLAIRAMKHAMFQAMLVDGEALS